MIRSLFAGLGQVATILYGCARARAARLAELKRDLARALNDADGLRDELRGTAAALATSEQRCNLLAHRVEEAESDVRAAMARAQECCDAEAAALQALGETQQALIDAERAREMLRGERTEAREQRDGLRLDLSMAEARIRDLEEALAVEREKVALFLRNEDANRALRGES